MDIKTELVTKYLKENDYNRYLITIFFPEKYRESIQVIYAFSCEIASIKIMINNPLMAQIRLKWWQEAINDIYSDTIRQHYIIKPLASIIHKYKIDYKYFDKILLARSYDFCDEEIITKVEFNKYITDIYVTIDQIVLKILGIDEEDKLITQNSYNYGIINILGSVKYQQGIGKKFILPLELMQKYCVNKHDNMTKFAEIIKELCQEISLQGIKCNYLEKNFRPILFSKFYVDDFLNKIKNCNFNLEFLSNKINYINILIKMWLAR